MTTRICARFSTPFPLGSCPPLPQPAPRGTWLAAAILGQAAPPLRPPTWRRPALSPPSGTGPCWPAKAEGTLSWAKILLGEKKTPVNGGARGSLMGFPERWHGLGLCHGARGPGGWAVCGGREVAAALSFCPLSKIHGCFSSLKCTRSSSSSFQCINTFQCVNSYSEAAGEAQQHLNPHPQWSSSIRPHAGLFHKTKCYTQKTDQTHPVYPTYSWDPKTWHRAITQNCNVVSAHRGHRCRQRWSNDL